MSESIHIAIDLGAGSGRLIAGRLDQARLSLEEIHRFDNPGTDLPGGSFWNILGLFRNILEGLRRAADAYGDRIASVGIDTWGCDYGLLDRDGRLLGLPHQYRDPRSNGMAALLEEKLGEAKAYSLTGIRTFFYNTSLHLLAESSRKSPALQQADRFLFIPDLLSFWLSGVAANEQTIASTSQLFNPHSRDWSAEVLDALDIPRKPFGRVVPPGTILGTVRNEVIAETGLPAIPVIASASHDTAAAVAGIPLTPEHNLWLSSGTWSIMGLELPQPITSPEALAAGFGNELGVCDTTRFLCNISGLWILQECRRTWSLEGESLDFAEMARLAQQATPFSAFIDPDDPLFASPGDMPAKIRTYCQQTNQLVPADKGSLLRVATESLALKYRYVYERLCRLTNRRYSRLHAGGGGIQNEMLSQATANALGLEVVAGPVEATSCGNLITQMMATGAVADLAAGRELIRKSFDFKTFQPNDRDLWEQAYQRFLTAVSL